MSQGSFFEFGIAHPLKNAKFRQPTDYSTTLSANVSAGVSSILVPLSAVDFFGQVNNPGDRLVIGPNSSGVSENAVINSIFKP